MRQELLELSQIAGAVGFAQAAAALGLGWVWKHQAAAAEAPRNSGTHSGHVVAMCSSRASGAAEAHSVNGHGDGARGVGEQQHAEARVAEVVC